MEFSTLLGGVLSYVFLTSATITILCIPDMIRSSSVKNYISPSALKVGITLGCLIFFAAVSKSSGMALAENAAYIGVIAYLIPILIIIWNKFSGIEDKSDIKSGLVLVLSTCSLIYFTRF